MDNEKVMTVKTPDATQDTSPLTVRFYREGNEPLFLSEAFGTSHDDNYDLLIDRLVPSGWRVAVVDKKTEKTVCTAVVSEKDFLEELMFKAVDMAEIFKAGKPVEQ